MGAEKEIEIWKQVPAHFDAKTLGESLKEMGTDYIETEDSNLQSRWFQSERDADLFIWTDINRKKTTCQQLNNFNAQEVIKYQLNFFGQVVEWSIFDGVRTGVIIENEIHGEIPSEVIEFDEHPQDASLEQASALLKFVSDLDSAEQKHLIDVLNQESPVAVKTGRQKGQRSSFQTLLKWMHLK